MFSEGSKKHLANEYLKLTERNDIYSFVYDHIEIVFLKRSGRREDESCSRCRIMSHKVGKWSL